MLGPCFIIQYLVERERERKREREREREKGIVALF